VAAYREALKEWTRERVPLDWARTQMNLGVVLGTLGERETGTARLDEAVAAYREALKEWTRERVPLDWARTQSNLGTALSVLGERETGTARLDEAVAAYREALKERSRERVPLDWAVTQSNLGESMMVIAERENDLDLAISALSQIEAALEVFRGAGHGPFADYCTDQAAKARSLVERLRKAH
jgi:tetratricopeptide (TPR) repeat protein